LVAATGKTRLIVGDDVNRPAPRAARSPEEREREPGGPQADSRAAAGDRASAADRWCITRRLLTRAAQADRTGEQHRAPVRARANVAEADGSVSVIAEGSLRSDGNTTSGKLSPAIGIVKFLD